MIAVFAVPAVTLLFAFGAGLLVLVGLRPDRRAVLLPAAPALGLAAVVVVLHWTSLVLPTRPVGLVLAIAVVLGLGAVAVTARHRVAVPVASLRDLALCAAIGAVAAGLALVPSLRGGSTTTLLPTGNHDAFWYVTVADWLGEHRAGERTGLGPEPGPGVGSPFLMPADRAARVKYRIGESLVHAAVAGASGRAVRDTWTPLTAAWPAVFPGAAFVLARLAGLKRLSALAGAATGALSAVFVHQVFNQNGPSTLALALAPAAVGLALVALRAPDATRADRVVAAVALTGTLGVYSEMAAVLGLPLLAVALTGTGTWRDRLVRTGALVALAVAVCPWVFIRMARYLTWLASVSTPSTLPEPRPYFDDGPAAVANRITGISEVSGRATAVAGLVVVAVVVAGIVAAARLPAGRRSGWGVFTVALAAVGGLGWLVCGLTDRRYLNGRVVDLVWPLVAVAAAASLVDAATAVRARRRVGALVAAVAGVLVVTLINTNTVWAAADPVPANRTITPELREAVAAAKTTMAPDGSDLTVLVDDYVQQLWIGEALHDRPQVGYLELPFGYTDSPRFVGPSLDRYALTSKSTAHTVAPGAVVWQNDEFILFDTTVGASAVFVTESNFYDAERLPNRVQRWMSDDGVATIVRSRPECPVTLHVLTLPELSPLPVAVGSSGPPVTLAIQAVDFPEPKELALAAAELSTVTLHNEKPSTRPANGDTRHVSMLVAGISWAPGSSCAGA